MPYEHTASSANPRLLILLTDELEESVRIINKIIYEEIIRNFEDDAPKNRYYISVIGYNHHAKVLCSGWLKDLDASPLRINTLIKKVPDGIGGIVEVEVKQPLWVESETNLQSFDSYIDAIKFAISLASLWADDQLLAPIVIDISNKCHTSSAMTEIEQLKAISTVDGNVLFWGSFPDGEVASGAVFSSMPKEWRWRFYNWEIVEKFFFHGILNREKLLPIISVISYTGGLPTNFNGFVI